MSANGNRRRTVCTVLALAVCTVSACERAPYSLDHAGPAVPAQRALDQPERAAALRLAMVQNQISARGVRDKKTLAAMRKVPRHLFIPKVTLSLAYGDHPVIPKVTLSLAYGDHPVGIGASQTISQPYIVALMTEALELKGGEKVLEIGTGSGYQAAVLAEIAAQVYTIEIIESLGRHAETLLDQCGYTNIEVRIGDGYQGWPEHAPFDAIIVTAAPDHIPQPLIDQLKPGGRLVIPVGESVQHLLRITKTDDGLLHENLLPVRFVPMTGQAMEKAPQR